MSAHLLLDSVPRPLPSPEAVARALNAGTLQPMPGTQYVVAALGARHATSLSELIFDLAVQLRCGLLLVGVEQSEAIRRDPARLLHYSARGAVTAVRGSNLLAKGTDADAAARFVSAELVHLVVDENFGTDSDLWSATSRRVGSLTSAQSAHALLVGRAHRILRGERLAPIERRLALRTSWPRRLLNLISGRES